MTPSTPANPIGRRLLDQGWRQGALLSSHGTEHGWARRRSEEGVTEGRWEWVTHSAPSEEWWVVASQDCDVAAKAEPRVELLRAFWTTDKTTIHTARLNSARNYLLARRTRADGKEEGLVADATVRLSVEKDSLLTLQPTQEVADLNGEAKRRFGEWLARRYSRAAIPDAIVNAIHKPLVKSLRALNEDDPLWRILDNVDQVRMSIAENSPPFSVSLVCILALGNQLNPLDEAEIRGWFSDVLDEQQQTHLEMVEFRSPESISLADYASRTPLSLDEFSQEA